MRQWAVIATAFGYLAFLFAVARFADRRAASRRSVADNGWVYALSLAVFATSWTFYGSVGLAAQSGIDFLPIHLGQTLVALLFWPVLRKIIRVAKTYHLTSIADFCAARYGNSKLLGALVTVLALLALAPYVALQIRAVVDSFAILGGLPAASPMPLPGNVPVWRDPSLAVALLLALFTIVLGTRHWDTNERHEGIVAAVGVDAIVKLVAFFAVGVFVAYGMHDGVAELFATAQSRLAQPLRLELKGADYVTWAWLMLVTMSAVFFLPRQFQVGVVENTREEHLKTAMWLFPLYLFAINLFVLPIALAGLLTVPGGAAQGDRFMLLLPLTQGADWLAWLAFIGGLSAAVVMVTVESVALSTMVSNNLVWPLLLRERAAQEAAHAGPARLLRVRRISVALVLLLAYAFIRAFADGYTLVGIGLVSFVAVAQFAPAMLGGLYWEGGTRRGAIVGVCAGFAVWAYTLVLPMGVGVGWIDRSFLELGPAGIDWLRPQALLGLGDVDPVAHAAGWSLFLNLGSYVVVSLCTTPSAVEQLQARRFVGVFDGKAGALTDAVPAFDADLTDVHRLLMRFLGAERANDALAAFAIQRVGHNRIDELKVDAGLTHYVQTLLAGAIGAASAQGALEAIARRDLFQDALTGLPSRAGFIDRVGAVLARARNEADYGFAVLCLDLDRYRLVVGSLGYHGGEQLLVEVSERLQRLLRPGDVLARIEGDEFALMLDGVRDLERARRAATALCRAIESPLQLAGHEIYTSADVGIVLVQGDGYEFVEPILRDARTAMVKAKARGHGQQAVFEPEMEHRALALFQLETDLRRALHRGELELHYQPIVALGSGALVGFEALLRWNHPVRGLVAAGEFIPLAEETGLVLPIGDWVLQQALRQIRGWQGRFRSDAPLYVSINVSARQFARPDLPDQLELLIRETGADPRTLVLEITETALIESADVASSTLARLRAAGIRIALDDFGTGYSSLSYLERFPVDVLKIDRSLVEGVAVDAKHAEIVEVIVMLARRLGMQVVAEGVESATQASRLVMLRAEFGQGYHFSYALNVPAAEAFIAAKVRRGRPGVPPA
jgi:diguanylate cyclase (GGDEF)-like protein